MYLGKKNCCAYHFLDTIASYCWFGYKSSVDLFACLKYCLRYTEKKDIPRARLWFYEGKKKILVCDERFHFLNRYKVCKRDLYPFCVIVFYLILLSYNIQSSYLFCICFVLLDKRCKKYNCVFPSWEEGILSWGNFLVISVLISCVLTISFRSWRYSKFYNILCFSFSFWTC